MSRIGKKPVPVPSNVTVTVSGQTVKVKGAKGELSFTMPEEIKVEKTAEGIEVTPRDDTKKARSMWGMSRTMVRNLIDGVTEGSTHTLEIHGVGFKAALKGKQIDLALGYSHPILHDIPEGIKITINDGTKLKIEGVDKQLVGQVTSEIRAYYPPEPYKGKGVRLVGEHAERVRRKEGKTVA
jgi:large subunit ribosomal protein L6